MSLMYAQMGLAAAGSVLNFVGAKGHATVAKAQQSYQNTVSAIQTAMSLNALTKNELSVRDAAQRADTAIQLQSMQDTAAAEVGAAAAGVKGGSVKSAMHGLARSRLQAKQALHLRLRGQAAQFADQRSSIKINAVLNKDVSVISKPSVGSALLGLGAQMLDIYDSHQPNGSKIEDRLSRIY